MIKVYLALMVVGILGAAAWGAKYYYDSTQARISQLVANNATLEERAKFMYIITKSFLKLEISQ